MTVDKTLPRKAALVAGERFYEGRPCKKGHVLRYTSSYQCVTCRRARIGPDYWPAYARHWRQKNPDKVRAIRRRWQAKEPPAQLQARRDRATAKRRALLAATLTSLREEGYKL